MKRSTLYLILAAAVLGGIVYYFEIRKHSESSPADEATASESKPAFTFKRDDIAEVDITRDNQTVKIENRDGKWVITEPVNTLADQTNAGAIADDLAGLRLERTFPAPPDKMKTYGLDQPGVAVEVRIKNDGAHRLRLGSKDFSGTSVYALVDDSKDVALVSSSLLSASDKSLNELWDRSVLDVAQGDVTSIDLANENGKIALNKEGAAWKIMAPVQGDADDNAVTSFLTGLTSGKAADLISESADNLTKYGLDRPKVTLTTHLQGGGERSLAVGSKNGNKYYAKSSDRAAIFEIDSSLYQKLNTKLSDLRDKQLARVDEDALARLKVTGPNGTLEAEKNGDKWTVNDPSDQKGKGLQAFKILDPIETNKATEIVDKPSSAIAAKLAKPAVTAELADKSGKTTRIKISAADGDSVYASVEGSPPVYKVPKKMLDDLSFRPSDVIQQ